MSFKIRRNYLIFSYFLVLRRANIKLPFQILHISFPSFWKVTKLKLKQKYKKEYADVHSIAFKNKASEIEATLFDSICKKIGCVAVVVTSINKGSLVVDFNVIFASRNVSASDVQATVNDAIKGPALAALRPDAMAKPQASRKFFNVFTLSFT